MKVFRLKIFCRLFAILLILTVGAGLPSTHALILIALGGEQGVHSCDNKTTAEIAELEFAERVLGPIPKASSELIFSWFTRLPVIKFAFIDRSLFIDEIKAFAELRYYIRDNNLHFNFPALVYRQPSSEHSTEG